MLTENFNVEHPKYVVCNLNDNFEQSEQFWNKYGNSILENLNHLFNKEINWNDNVEMTKAVVCAYIDYCHNNPDIFISLELFYSDMINKAILPFSDFF